MGLARHVPIFLMVLLVIATLYLAVRHRQLYPGVPDSVGYMQASLQLAQGRGLAYADSHNAIGHSYYTLHTFKVFRPQSPNRYLDYPPGLPLIGAGLIRLTGRAGAVFWAVPLLAGLLMAATCLVGYLMFGAWTALWSGVVLFAMATFWEFGTAIWSEIPGAALLYLGCALYLLATRRIRRPVASTILAGIGGLFVGATFFMRFSNVSVLPGVALFVFLLAARGSRGWLREPVAFMCGTGAGFVAILSYNTLYYGGPFTTSYTPQNGWYTFAPFALEYAFGKSPINGSSMPAVGRLLWQDFVWLLPFGVLGALKRPRREALALLGLSLCLLAPYAFYAFAAEGMNSRFVLPAWPALCILVGRGLSTLLGLVPGRIVWPGRIVLAAAILFNVPAYLGQVDERNRNEAEHYTWARDVAALTEPDAVLMSYLNNDVLAVYGGRSVLNFRHIVTYDPTARADWQTRFTKSFQSETDRLLEAGTPVYYVHDQDPSYANSFELLSKDFRLELVSEKYQLYRVAQ
jgi:4-amino-4-deoxy-L-arabinose transferase-like glycosyltransferase